jgi:thiamine pyrophosphate-dependent acetolactate synthase large subunit-like protein
MGKTAAEFLVESLEKTSVKVVYGVVGDACTCHCEVSPRRSSRPSIVAASASK